MASVGSAEEAMVTVDGARLCNGRKRVGCVTLTEAVGEDRALIKALRFNSWERSTWERSTHDTNPRVPRSAILAKCTSG